MMAYAPTKSMMAAGSPPTSNPTPSRGSGAHRHRKTVSTGGGRAWSEAEEAYLIETREHKMPYKHIAAQLKKTELACRLHYHQLSFGNRSRRSASTQPGRPYDRSATATLSPTPRQSAPQQPLPNFSPPASPPEATDRSPVEAGSNAVSHKPLLPKPTMPSDRTTPSSRSLKLVTDDMKNDRPFVDLARLDRLYDIHRLHFWSTIARSYGSNLSPAYLEDAWLHAHNMTGSNFPPTPRGSPHSSQAQPSILATPFSALPETGACARGFTPINGMRESSLPPANLRASSVAPTGPPPPLPPPSSVPAQLPSSSSSSHISPPAAGPGLLKNSCAISSLLTDNREVRRSPSRERNCQDIEKEYAARLEAASSASSSSSPPPPAQAAAPAVTARSTPVPVGSPSAS